MLHVIIFRKKKKNVRIISRFKPCIIQTTHVYSIASTVIYSSPCISKLIVKAKRNADTLTCFILFHPSDLVGNPILRHPSQSARFSIQQQPPSGAINKLHSKLSRARAFIAKEKHERQTDTHAYTHPIVSSVNYRLIPAAYNVKQRDTDPERLSSL